ncbi:hypothetical protein [Shinella sp.]|uniref:hypothetical protein n=1 Tax=Shinella sp. TaxID=1870904 RepID=UPI003D292FAA
MRRNEQTRKFAIGDRVRKHSGSWWEGRVVGFYSTEQTPSGYCVQLDMVPNGPVQIYPEAALELAAPPAISTVAPPCGIADPSTRDCENMKEVGGGMDGERYRCDVCGKGYFLDYEEMK